MEQQKENEKKENEKKENEKKENEKKEEDKKELQNKTEFIRMEDNPMIKKKSTNQEIYTQLRKMLDASIEEYKENGGKLV